MLGILALVILIFMVGFFHPQTLFRLMAAILIGAWIFLVGILAVIGLSAIDGSYVEQNVITWIFASLATSLVLQIVLRYLSIRAQQRPSPQPRGDGDEPQRPPGPQV